MPGTELGMAYSKGKKKNTKPLCFICVLKKKKSHLKAKYCVVVSEDWRSLAVHGSEAS